jgi:hypothetical protein
MSAKDLPTPELRAWVRIHESAGRYEAAAECHAELLLRTACGPGPKKSWVN